MSATSTTASFRVTGMSCGNCVRHVTHAAEAVPGVSRVEVDLAGGRATVSFDPASTTPAAIAAAITAAGYEATEATAR
jgi:copper chaperone CopZ